MTNSLSDRSEPARAASHSQSPSLQAAWSNYLTTLDAARTQALGSRFNTSMRFQTQAMYYMSLLQAFGFNIYMGPRQAFPTFYSHHYFTPVEYGWGAPCPDFRYHWTAIDGRRTYRIWGTRGNTEWLHIQAQRGWYGDRDQTNIGSWDVDDFALSEDGGFEIIASATPQQGNWMKLDPDASYICLLVRDIWDRWETSIGATIHIELIDPQPDNGLFHGEEEICDRLNKLAEQTRFSIEWFLGSYKEIFEKAGGFNAFWLPEVNPENIGANPRAAYVQMAYDIAPSEALIVECELPETRYWSLHMADWFLQTTDYRFHHSSLNGKQAYVGNDNVARLVIANSDPGVLNWIDTCGLPQGLAMWRWYLSKEHRIPKVRKVPLSAVRDNLPSDTPMVSPAQRQAMLEWRRKQIARRFGV